MSTPINQLPPGQPVANDPILVQQIIKESMQEQNYSSRQQPIQELQYSPQQQYQRPMTSPSYYKPLVNQKPFDYMKIIKDIFLVAIIVFISQMSSITDFIKTYITSNELNIIIRSLLAGTSYVGLDIIF